MIIELKLIRMHPRNTPDNENSLKYIQSIDFGLWKFHANITLSTHFNPSFTSDGDAMSKIIILIIHYAYRISYARMPNGSTYTHTD